MMSRRPFCFLLTVLCFVGTAARGSPPSPLSKSESDPLAGLIEGAAPEGAPSRLTKARSLKCVFGPGSHAEWKNGTLVAGTGGFGPPGEKSTIYYDSINPTTHKARLIGTGGSGDLNVVVDGVDVTLIEAVPMGGFAITTIYASYDSKKAFPAVMSKHVDLLGPFPH